MFSGKGFGNFTTRRTSPIEIHHGLIEMQEAGIMRELRGRKW